MTTPHPNHPNLILFAQALNPTLDTEGVATTPAVRIYADPTVGRDAILAALIGCAHDMLGGNR